MPTEPDIRSNSQSDLMILSNNLNIALLPMTIEWGEKTHNLNRLASLLSQVHPDTDLVILPETFSTGFPSGMDKEQVREWAERNSGNTIELIKKLAAHHNVAIAGTFIADTGGSLYNRAFFIEPSGDETFADKRHLFTMAGEDKVFSRGYDRLKVRYRGWEIAMVVCYDIRFPVWCRNTSNDYDLLIASANWPVVRVDAWNQLLKARAIENLAYVAGVNCRGVDMGNFEYDGASAVFDFKGKDVSLPQHVDEITAVHNGVRMPERILYATLHRDKLDAFRRKFPAYLDADPFTIVE